MKHEGESRRVTSSVNVIRMKLRVRWKDRPLGLLQVGRGTGVLCAHPGTSMKRALPVTRHFHGPEQLLARPRL